MEKDLSLQQQIKKLVNSKHILVIDDEPVWRDALKHMLEMFGYTVTLTKDGQEGLDYYTKNHENIDLVLLDFKMPKLNGKDCFWAMKKVNPKLKCYLLTGYAETERVKEMHKEGIGGMIAKPFEMATVKEILAGALAG